MNFLSLLVAVVYLKWIGVEAGPTGVQTVFSKIRESTQTKCIYVTEWFKIEPDYLRQCPRIEVVTSVKLAEIDSNKFAFLCNLFLKYFETLCDANSRSNNTPPNKPPMEVKDSSTVCTELLKYQHDSNLTNTRCNALCTDLATEKAEPICLGMAQLAAATYTIQSTNPEQPMRSEPHNVESEQPVRSDAPQLDNTAVRETTPKPQTMPVDKTPETLKVDKVTQQQNGEGEAVVANVKNKEQEGREDTPNNAKLNNVQVDESDNAQETMVESQGDDGHVKLAQGKTSLQEVANGVESPRAFEEEADIDGDTQEDLDENVPQPKPSNIEKIMPSEKITKPLNVEREDELNYPANFQNQSIDDGDSYFFSYFMMVCVTFIGCYVAYHNKQKILALVVEGRRGRRPSRSTRRPNSANYHKLDSNLEEAMNSSCNKNTSQVIY